MLALFRALLGQISALFLEKSLDALCTWYLKSSANQSYLLFTCARVTGFFLGVQTFTAMAMMWCCKRKGHSSKCFFVLLFFEVASGELNKLTEIL